MRTPGRSLPPRRCRCQPRGRAACLTAFAAGLTAPACARRVAASHPAGSRGLRLHCGCLTGGIVLLRTENVAGALVALVLLGRMRTVFRGLGYIGSAILRSWHGVQHCAGHRAAGQYVVELCDRHDDGRGGSGIFPIVVTSTMRRSADVLGARGSQPAALPGRRTHGDNHTDAKEE